LGILINMFQAARIAKKNLAKHTEFKVGGYLETNSYGISAGNVQHESDRLTLCAEMLAMAQCKSNGLIPKHLHLTTDEKRLVYPCGVCRHYLSEYPNLKVTTYNVDGSKRATRTVNQLYPNRFWRNRING